MPRNISIEVFPLSAAWNCQRRRDVRPAEERFLYTSANVSLYVRLHQRSIVSAEQSKKAAISSSVQNKPQSFSNVPLSIAFFGLPVFAIQPPHFFGVFSALIPSKTDNLNLYFVENLQKACSNCRNITLSSSSTPHNFSSPAIKNRRFARAHKLPPHHSIADYLRRCLSVLFVSFCYTFRVCIHSYGGGR